MTTVVVIIVATLALHVFLLVRLARKQAALDRAKAESDFRAGENLARLDFSQVGCVPRSPEGLNAFERGFSDAPDPVFEDYRDRHE